MRIYSDDGKEFKNVAECNAYEAEQALKKQKEETERKAKEEAKEKALKEVNDAIALLNQAKQKYEEKHTGKLYFMMQNGELTAKTYDTLSNGLLKEFFHYFN